MILQRASTFLDGVLRTNGTTRDALWAYASSNVKDLNANIAEAAKAQVDAYVTALDSWMPSPGDARWHDFSFVASSSHMARRGSLVSQTFSAMLAARTNDTIVANAPNQHAIFLEIPDSEDYALASLGGHALDYIAGVAFFNDTYRLHRDAMADATTAYLQKLFPSAGKVIQQQQQRQQKQENDKMKRKIDDERQNTGAETLESCCAALEAQHEHASAVSDLGGAAVCTKDAGGPNSAACRRLRVRERRKRWAVKTLMEALPEGAQSLARCSLETCGL